MADLQRLDIIVDKEDVDMVSGILTLRAAHGWEEEDLSGGGVCFRVHGQLPEVCRDIQEEVTALVDNARLELVDVEEKDWTEAWREFFTLVNIDDTFLVAAPWMPEAQDAAQGAKAPYPLVINPKTAFGTGHHQSTALCLKALARWYKSGDIAPGQTFFDLGTGSGILALACARLGLTGLACDIDPVAVDNALENRAQNGLNDKFEVLEGGLDCAQGQVFDCVLANILAWPLREMAPGLVRLVKPGGCLVLSGILTDQADAVEDAYRKQGLPKPERINEESRDGGWTALVWSKAQVS